MKPTDVAAYLDRCRTLIATSGHMVQAVLTTPYSYSYTIGLTPALGAELLTIGLPHATAGGFLNDVAKKLREREIPDGELITGLANLPFKLATHAIPDDDAARSLITVAFRLGYRPTQVRLLLWPDPQGRFPDDPGYAFPVPQTLGALLVLTGRAH